MTEVRWDSPLSVIGGKAASKVVKATGLATVGDLLRHFPRTYVAKGSLSDLGTLTEGDMLSMVGRIVGSEQKPYRDRRSGRTAYRLEVVVVAEDGRLTMNWFDRHKGTADWRTRELAVGRIGMFSGRLKWWRNDWELVNPDARMYGESAADALAAMPDLIPIYPTPKGIDTWQIEETVGFALTVLDRFPEVLPAGVRDQQGLIGAADAYRWIHRPDTHGQLGLARARLRFDEAYVAQTVLARRRAERERSPSRRWPLHAGGLLDRFDERLPYDLTAGQREVGNQITVELAGDHPMHRLLQGEVGSGKTLVALRAMLQVVDAGGQAALLAPTEVLAQQHHRSITTLLGDLAEGGLLGGADGATRVVVLTGSMGTAARRQTLLDAASGQAGIVIGTHALLEDTVTFADLGLVVIDEQHRFGVEQRSALAAKATDPPHVLVMTATPIPRTVAMTVFGDLDTSTLRELPAGRGEVQTTVVPVRSQPAWLERAWARIREEVGQGRQAYVVCSRIGDEPPPDDGPELTAVEDLGPELADGPLAGISVGILHGRMTPEEKDRVMTGFADGAISILVSTTVIEVGVDVPNATVMVVMDADRFGVSQLHQLRGRIGRGGHDGLCLLVTATDPAGVSMERLAAVAATRDGFVLSRIDLEQRREGNLLGAEQSGHASDLRLLSVLRDEDVIVAARQAATAYLAGDPDLAGVPDLRDAVLAAEVSQQADFLEMG